MVSLEKAKPYEPSLETHYEDQRQEEEERVMLGRWNRPFKRLFQVSNRDLDSIISSKICSFGKGTMAAGFIV